MNNHANCKIYALFDIIIIETTENKENRPRCILTMLFSHMFEINKENENKMQWKRNKTECYWWNCPVLVKPWAIIIWPCRSNNDYDNNIVNSYSFIFIIR